MRLRIRISPAEISAQELVHAIDHSFTGVGGQFHYSRIHSDGIFRAGLYTKAAKNADANVNIERLGHLFDIGIGILLGNDMDAAGGASGLAHHTGYAPRRSVITAHQAVARSKPAGKGTAFFGIFNGYGFPLPDLKSKGAGDMPGKIAHKVPGCKRQAAGYFSYIELFK